MLVHEILEGTAARLPDKVALIEGSNTLTYRAVVDQVAAFSAGLAGLGIARGDRVALLFPNCIEFCIAYFAALRLGAIVVPLNNRLAPAELSYALNDSGARAVVLDQTFLDTVVALRNDLEQMLTIIATGDEPAPGIQLFSAIASAGGSVPKSPAIDFDDPACIMYTSGTTGLPKGAVMSHRNIFANARNAGAHMGYRESDTTLIVVPLFHVTGLNTQLVAFCYVGGTVAIMRSYNTAGMIELLARHSVTTMITVPTMYTLMLTNPALKAADLSSLRALSFGGAPMAPDTIAALKDRLGVALFNAYGLTETSSIATVMPACDTERKGASVGLAATGVRLRVVDDLGDELLAGSVGELWIKGPNIVKSYWNKPGATAENLADGWLRTGDYARIDDEGFVYIVDRKKDMINRGGENIYCIEVEAALVEDPQVLEAAVVPRAHTIFGEVVHAFVVVAPGEAPTEDEIIARCAGRIADYKVPASVSFVAELPRNPGGKVLKKALREQVPPGDPPRR